MLNSSSEYMKALRRDKYLLFLEWPQFIAEQYKEGDKSQDADDTLNMLVFEWLNHGYCEEDAKKIALLMAVHDLESRPLRGNLSYALTSIAGAVFQCMLYLDKNLHAQFLTKDKMNKQKINQLMNGPVIGLDKLNFEKLLMEQQTIFFNWVDNVQKVEVEKANLQICPLTDLRYFVEEYIFDLESSKIPGDELRSSRLSVVKRLAQYLNEQTEFKAEINDEIAAYVSKIREMKPVDFENKYLLGLSKPSLEDNTWKMFTSLGMSFFNLLQLNQSPVIETGPTNTIEPKI